MPRDAQGNVIPGSYGPAGPPPQEQQPPAPDEAPPEPPMEQSGMETPTDPFSGQMQQASPEEQEQADQFVGRAWQLIYDDATFPEIVEMLKGGQGGQDEQGNVAEQGDPTAGLAAVADMIVARVGQAAEDAGQKLFPDAVFHAIGDIVEELAEVSRRAKIKDYSQDKNALESAYFQTLDLYHARLQDAGVVDQESHKQGLSQLQKADQDGSYERTLRTLAESDTAGPAGGPEPPPQKERRPKGFNGAMGI